MFPAGTSLWPGMSLLQLDFFTKPNLEHHKPQPCMKQNHPVTLILISCILFLDVLFIIT
jgi:hypothetical protein